MRVENFLCQKTKYFPLSLALHLKIIVLDVHTLKLPSLGNLLPFKLCEHPVFLPSKLLTDCNLVENFFAFKRVKASFFFLAKS